MAVQAQYPSNVLLLNRTGQEEHDYSLQPQLGGFLDQSRGGATNPRKREREIARIGIGGGITTPATDDDFNPLFYMQNQPLSTRLIELSQLHNNNKNNSNNTNQNQQQPNAVSTGLRLSFGDLQQQSHHHHYQQHHQQHQHSFGTSLSSVFSKDFANQIKRQQDELDQFLQAQGEQLRSALAEKRQRHYHALLGAAEEAIATRLKEKEAEMEKAKRRNAELEARAAQLSVEAQVWQAKARAQEATAATLQAQLQQAIIRGGLAQDSRTGEEGPGCDGRAEDKVEDAESAYVDPDRIDTSGVPSCKACRQRVASVVMLPCRHLSVCTECDGEVEACPVCLHARNSSVEVIMC